MTSLWHHLWPTYQSQRVFLLSGCAQLISWWVLKICWLSVSNFGRYRRKMREGQKILKKNNKIKASPHQSRVNNWHFKLYIFQLHFALRFISTTNIVSSLANYMVWLVLNLHPFVAPISMQRFFPRWFLDRTRARILFSSSMGPVTNLSKPSKNRIVSSAYGLSSFHDIDFLQFL